MENLTDVINLIKSFAGQANILTIPRVFVDLTGDIKAALFLSQCVYWSSRSSTPGMFYKTYQEWQDEIALGRYEIDNIRKRISRYVKTELKRSASGVPTLHYVVDMNAIARDITALYNKDVQTGDSQTHLLETSKPVCWKPANPFVGNQQIHLLETSKPEACALNVFNTEPTTELTAEPTAARTAAAVCESPADLPSDIRKQLSALGWRGSLADVEQAWREDPERVRQWLWYARRQGWSGALLRTVLRNPGEYPPELEPGSEAELCRRREDMLRFGVYPGGEDDFEAADDEGESLEEIKSKLVTLHCEDLFADIEAAWQEDPERVRQWTWYALSFAHGKELFRTAVCNPGEYPPRLKPDGRVNPVER